MNRHPNALLTVALSLILGMFLAACSTGPQPQNSNTSAQSNENANANATHPGTQPLHPGAPEGWVDGIKGEAKTGGIITVIGWAADAQDGVPVKKLEVLLDDKVV